MKHVSLVVDDFYDDPDSLVERALGLEYQRESGVNYPGVMAKTFQDVGPLMKSFSDLLGGMDIRYKGTQGSFRITTEQDATSRVGIVHLDSSDFSAVIHLSKTPMEGTYFYRHKELGLEYVSPEDNRRPEVRAAIERDSLNLDAWEVTHLIPMKYNRLLIFDGKYFHSGARRLVGTRLSEGRITQNFFFFRA